MRKKNQKQMPLMIKSIDHPHAEDLKSIGQILDAHPIINEMVLQDLTGNVVKRDTGAEGMSAKQVLRAAIIKQMEGFSYEDLAFNLLDCVCYRSFCRIGFADKGFGKSALCHNIKSISPETWEAINRILVGYGQDKDRRETLYGHKICLSSGQSNLITDCFILDGNPADSTLTDQMLDRHREIYGYYPLKVAFDGGFASKNNLKSSISGWTLIIGEIK